MLSQKYPSILKSIHPSSVRTSKEKKKFSSPTQHQQTNKQTRWWKKKKLQPIQPNPIQPNPTQPNPTQPSYQKDTTTLIVHIYLYLLWHREN